MLNNDCRILNGIQVDGEMIGLNLSELGAQEKLYVKSQDGDVKELVFNTDGSLSMYSTADAYSNGRFTSPSGTKVDGYTTETDGHGSFISSMLKINSFFLGGEYDPSKGAAATHNYVELANSLRVDIDLNSVMLMYLPSEGSAWKCLPLKGKIPAGGTYLIRGAKVSDVYSNEAMNVDSYDIEWYDGKDLIDFTITQGGKKVLKGGTFYLVCHNNGQIFNSEGVLIDPKTLPINVSPYVSSKNAPKGYIDCVGAQINGASGVYAEGNPISIKANESLYKCIFTRWSTLDACSKLVKAWAKRKTTNFWTYCNMELSSALDAPYWTGDLKARLAPAASYKGKSFSSDKRVMSTTQPNCINQTFGRQGSYADASHKATRCFTWVSVGYYDEYLEYRKKGDSDWNRLYSIDAKDYALADGKHYGDKSSVLGTIQAFIKVYSRMRWDSVSHRMNVTHRVILPGLEAGDYEYRVGRDNDNTYTSGIRKFSVRSNADIAEGGFSFAQTTDQQGYSFYEYQAWTKSAFALSEAIKNKKYFDVNKTATDWDGFNHVDFLINTGDASQNGNRENEWLDYYEGKLDLCDMPEMAIIGNNDLCGINLGTLDDDAVANDSKISSMSLWCYYTFEFDVNNPPYFVFKPTEFKKELVGKWALSYDESKGEITYFVPSMYSYDYGNYHFVALNSEFATNSGVYKLYYDNSTYSTGFQRSMYYQQYKWMEKDVKAAGNKKKIAYAHEIPYCIVPTKSTNKGCKDRNPSENGQSKLNFDFSGSIAFAGSRGTTSESSKFAGGCCYSEFFQNNGVRLVLGGHKHTYSLSYPLYENVTYNESSRSVEPNKPILVMSDGVKTRQKNAGETGFDATVAATKPEAATNPVVYCMCQATGYKLESNNDKPGNWINWLNIYFPYNETKVNAGQTWPMCNVVSCSDTNTVLKSFRIVGPTAADTSKDPANFNINSQNSSYLMELTAVAGSGSNGGVATATITY